MSELKAYTFSNTEGRGLAEYYLKSEADKVIAHANYKRCLAMAEQCRWRAKFFDDDKDEGGWEYKHRGFWLKWNTKWLELAEKFKSNLTAQ